MPHGFTVPVLRKGTEVSHVVQTIVSDLGEAEIVSDLKGISVGLGLVEQFLGEIYAKEGLRLGLSSIKRCLGLVADRETLSDLIEHIDLLLLQ